MFVLVMAILLIIVAAGDFILAIATFMSASTLAQWGVPVGSLVGVGLLALTLAILSLVAGIQGIRYSTEPKMAGTLVGLGVCILIAGIILLVVNLAIGANPLTALLGLTIPIVNIIAVGRFKANAT
ncbi:MAG: hypothetical protein LBN10_05470 [Propionibacteriaceae bacterium]|nr:hypothetical protein [Propionibacteriaceae bacterium]